MTTLLNSTEAGKRLVLDPSRIRLLCRQGRFPGAQRVGRDWIIPADAVAKFTRREPGRPKTSGNGKNSKKSGKSA